MRYRLSQAGSFRNTTKYGVSLINSAIETFKRLKLSEDSVLMARITRGMKWYAYKVKVAGVNFSNVSSLIESYKEIFKRNSSLDLTQGNSQWKDRFQPIVASVEDIFIPESDDVSCTIEPHGGEVDIRAIVDVEMLEQRLLGGLRVSKVMLGITDDMPAFGQEAGNRISINFAKNVFRLSACLRAGIKRMCQIEAAYRGLNTNPDAFEVHIGTGSSAEEEELKNALKSGVEVAEDLSKFLQDHLPDANKEQILEYVNKKILKLSDLTPATLKGQANASTENLGETKRNENIVTAGEASMDLSSYLPENKIYYLNEDRKYQALDCTWIQKAVKFEQPNPGARA